MATTVYFATNRIVTNPSDPDGGYTSAIVPPLKPEEITYGTAIIDDVRYDTFDLPSPAGLSGLTRLSEGIEVYFSRADQVLQVSMVVNLGAKRLGQDGPHNRADRNAFPPDKFGMVDCTDIRDYEFNFFTSHQYYRMSPQVRSIMAAGMAGPVVA